MAKSADAAFDGTVFSPGSFSDLNDYAMEQPDMRMLAIQTAIASLDPTAPFSIEQIGSAGYFCANVHGDEIIIADPQILTAPGGKLGDADPRCREIEAEAHGAKLRVFRDRTLARLAFRKEDAMAVVGLETWLMKADCVQSATYSGWKLTMREGESGGPVMTIKPFAGAEDTPADDKCSVLDLVGDDHAGRMAMQLMDDFSPGEVDRLRQERPSRRRNHESAGGAAPSQLQHASVSSITRLITRLRQEHHLLRDVESAGAARQPSDQVEVEGETQVDVQAPVQAAGLPHDQQDLSAVPSRFQLVTLSSGDNALIVSGKVIMAADPSHDSPERVASVGANLVEALGVSLQEILLQEPDDDWTWEEIAGQVAVYKGEPAGEGAAPRLDEGFQSQLAQALRPKGG